MNMIVKIFIAAILFSITLYAKETNSKILLDDMIKAYGGVESLKQLNDYEQYWQIEAKMSNTIGSDTRIVKMPAYLYTKLQYPHKLEIRELKGNSGLKQMGDRVMKAQGPMLDAMKAQMMRLFHPLELNKRTQSIKLVQNQSHYILSLTQDGVYAEYHVSKKSLFIEKVIGRVTMGRQSMDFTTLYQDYNDVNGVMMPHTEIKYAGSVNTAIMRLQKTRFAKPKSKYLKLVVAD